MARPLVALLAEPPDPFRPKCKLDGATSTNTAAIAASATDTYTVPRTSQRQAARIARPNSSAAMLDCEKLVISPASSHASIAAPHNCVRFSRPHSTTVVTAIITSARKRP